MAQIMVDVSKLACGSISLFILAQILNAPLGLLGLLGWWKWLNWRNQREDYEIGA